MAARDKTAYSIWAKPVARVKPKHRPLKMPPLCRPPDSFELWMREWNTVAERARRDRAKVPSHVL